MDESQPYFEPSDALIGRLAAQVRAGGNPFDGSVELSRTAFSLNGFGLNWLCGESRVEPGLSWVDDLLCDALLKHDGRLSLIPLLGRVLRGEELETSWLNTLKQRSRHPIVECFYRLLHASTSEDFTQAILAELFSTVATRSPLVTVDARGQCVDLLLAFVETRPKATFEHHVQNLTEALTSFTPLKERSLSLQLLQPHDTIDPFIELPNAGILDVLRLAAKTKAEERSFVFAGRLLRGLIAIQPDLEPFLDPVRDQVEASERQQLRLRAGVLTAPKFERFISSRLPSHCASLEDYVVNRHAILIQGLTVQELCRWLIASPENGSCERTARITIAGFYRQVLAIGQACNIGLDARPFFIDHGCGANGERLDWPAYVFLPAGVIWGKGAAVDLSCGVAFGGGVDLEEERGRDGAYIGGSWSATLYHGHSHVGGSHGSKGAESRDKILHYGLTVDDGKRLPWAAYVEAEDHLRGDIHEGVQTYLLSPRIAEDWP